MTARLALASAIAALLAIPGSLSAAEPITGNWKTAEGDAIVTIGTCGQSTCGRISKFLVPPPDGIDQRDINNPDPARQKRKLLGLPVLNALDEGEDAWRGNIYDPKTGRSYTSVVRRKDANTLEVQGCISIFCQTQVWTRVR